MSCTASSHWSSAPKGQKVSHPHPQEDAFKKINQRASSSSNPHLENPATPKEQQRTPFPHFPRPSTPPPVPSKECRRAQLSSFLPPHPHPPPTQPQEPAAVKGRKRTPSPPWPPIPPDFLLNCPTGEGSWNTQAHDAPFPPPLPSPVLPIQNEVRHGPCALEEIRREVKLREVESNAVNSYELHIKTGRCH